MKPEQIALLNEINERLKRVENYTTNIGGSLEFKKTVQTYAGQAESIRTEKFGLAKAPVTRQSNIAGPSGGITQDAEVRTAINSILTLLDNFGFTS